LPPNETVVFVDGFDVLVQRPVADIKKIYEEMAAPLAHANGGHWPVIFGGERNCWPFPHNGTLEVVGSGGTASQAGHIYQIPEDAVVSGDHHGHWEYHLGAGRFVKGMNVCGEFMARYAAADAASLPYPFPNMGTLVGRASAVRKLLRQLFRLSEETGEYSGQGLLLLLFLQGRAIADIDTRGRLILSLHGFDERIDLARPLCRGSYFEPARSPQAAVDGRSSLEAHDSGAETFREAARHRFASIVPPALRENVATPAAIHFNGNGKRHYWRCVREFHAHGLFRRTVNDTQCSYLNVDRGGLETVNKMRDRSIWPERVARRTAGVEESGVSGEGDARGAQEVFGTMAAREEALVGDAVGAAEDLPLADGGTPSATWDTSGADIDRLLDTEWLSTFDVVQLQQAASALSAALLRERSQEQCGASPLERYPSYSREYYDYYYNAATARTEFHGLLETNWSSVVGVGRLQRAAARLAEVLAQARFSERCSAPLVDTYEYDYQYDYG